MLFAYRPLAKIQKLQLLKMNYRCIRRVIRKPQTLLLIARDNLEL